MSWAELIEEKWLAVVSVRSPILFFQSTKNWSLSVASASKMLQDLHCMHLALPTSTEQSNNPVARNPERICRCMTVMPHVPYSVFQFVNCLPQRSSSVPFQLRIQPTGTSFNFKSMRCVHNRNYRNPVRVIDMIFRTYPILIQPSPRNRCSILDSSPKCRTWL